MVKHPEPMLSSTALSRSIQHSSAPEPHATPSSSFMRPSSTPRSMEITGHEPLRSRKAPASLFDKRPGNCFDGFQLSVYLSVVYKYLVLISRFWEIKVIPVQKKGLTRWAADDTVHLGTRSSVFFAGAFIIPSERSAVPESARQLPGAL